MRTLSLARGGATSSERTVKPSSGMHQRHKTPLQYDYNSRTTFVALLAGCTPSIEEKAGGTDPGGAASL